MNRIIRPLIFFVLLFLSATIEAQETINSELDPEIRSTILIRYSFMDHLHIKQPSSQIGLEVKANETWGLYMESGIIHERLNIFNLGTRSIYRNNRKVRGYKVVGEVRYYPTNRWYGEGFFISIRHEFEQSTITREERYIRNKGEYIESRTIEIANTSRTTMLNFGANIYQRAKASITIVNGLGIKHRKYTSDIPADAVRISSSFNLLSDRLGETFRPVYHLGIYLTFGI